MKLYLKVTNDKYELPIAVAESQTELARLLGVSRTAVNKAYKYQERCIHATSSYKEVEVEDD